MMTKLCNKIWKEEKVPKDWEAGIVMPIFKKERVVIVATIGESLC